MHGSKGKSVARIDDILQHTIKILGCLDDLLGLAEKVSVTLDTT